MTDTCSIFYEGILNFGSEIWLYYPIDKTEVPILYKPELEKRSLKKPFKFRKSQTERRLCVGKSLRGGKL